MKKFSTLVSFSFVLVLLFTNNALAKRQRLPANADCTQHEAHRMKCYEDLLSDDDRIINELNGENPFQLSSWESVALNDSAYAKQIKACRETYPKLCQ